MQAQAATPLTKAVSFNPRVQMRRAIHINDYSTKARKTAFYTQEDLVQFKREAKKTAKMIESSSEVLRDNGNNFCRRGVEGMTKDGAALRSTNRKKALEVVLSEADACRQLSPQQQQQGSSLPSDERIAAKYAVAAEQAVAKAHLSGLLDESMVRAALRSEEQKNAILRAEGSTNRSHCQRRLIVLDRIIRQQSTRNFQLRLLSN